MNNARTVQTFHPGEQAMQDRVGVREKMQALGSGLIRNHMPEQHRELFKKLPMLIIGAVDKWEAPWATVLTGRPGFIQSPDNKTLEVYAGLTNADPLASALCEQQEVGVLGIEFETRRRNRASAIIEFASREKLRLKIKQSFGNCPRYIQRRRHVPVELPPLGIESRDFDGFDDSLAASIQGADSFFIASVFTDGSECQNRGVDVSHRGGMPGFIQVIDERTLVFPDYNGNQFFNTLGNLQLNPKAGLLFIGYQSNTLLHLTGTAEVIWESEALVNYPGAERLVRFTLKGGRAISNALPLAWEFEEYSPLLGKFID